MSSILSRYHDRTPGSARIDEASRRSIAGGTSRQTSWWSPYPITLVRGEGSLVRDIDGNEYLDLINNFTALIHGHAYPPVVEAVTRALPSGWLWSANNVHQVELAELLCERVGSVSAVRFCNSGSEAAALGLKLARAATGRRKVLMARFGYHGMVADFEAGSMNLGGPDTLIGDFNDAESFEAALGEHGAEIAGVFLEPMLGAGGVLVGGRDFFERVARATRAAGAVFALDEVQTLRLAVGGLQSLLGLDPDLTLFGKFIGGGFPAGAVGGKAEIMALLDPSQLKAYHSGTFNANPISMLAGAITVRDLTAPAIEHLALLGEQLERGLRAAGARLGVPVAVNRTGSLLNLFLMERSPRNVFERTDEERFRRFHLACLNRGLFFAARGYLVLATNMTAELIDEAVARAALAMQDLLEDVP